MRRDLLGTGAALAAISAAVVSALGASTTAVADTTAPAVTAWWNVQNQGIVAPPAPAGVNAGDLFVEGAGGDQKDPATPLPPFPSGVGTKGAADAISGLSLTIPSGAKVGLLTLHFDGSAPASPSVEACRATAPFGPQQNGPWSDVPPYDCTTTAVGKLAPDGKSILFADIGALVKDGRLTVVLVPQFYDREVWLKPGADAITFTPPPPTFDLAPTAQLTFPAPADTGVAALPPAFVPPQTTLAPPAGSGTAPPTQRQPIVALPPVETLGSKNDRLIAAVLLVAALCLFALMMGANTTLMRRLFGARVAHAMPGHGSGVQGLGRFARPREGRPDSI